MWGGHVLFIPIGIKKSCIPFSEIPINTSSDMVLGCGFSFSGFSARKTGLTFWKSGSWVFSGGWDMFFWQNLDKMKYKRPERSTPNVGAVILVGFE